MKLHVADFSFDVKSRRPTKDLWTAYYTALKKTDKNDVDKYLIKNFRELIKKTEWTAQCVHKKSKITFSEVLKEKKINREELMKKAIAKVKAERTNRRKINKVAKIFDGSNYEIVSGVFEKPGQINEIAKRVTGNDPHKPKMPKLPNVNYIGVELEFNRNDNYETKDIGKKLQDAGLSKYVYVGTDPSCGFEVRVLLREDDFINPLTNILNVLNDMGFSTDRNCGTHVHFDMRNRDPKQCYKALFQTQSFLRKFLNRARKTNSYCKINKEIDFDKASKVGDRYLGINATSYSKYKTIEIRMHQGTLKVDELVPWIKLILKVINSKVDLTKKVLTLKQAESTFGIEKDLKDQLQDRLMKSKKLILSQGA